MSISYAEGVVDGIASIFRSNDLTFRKEIRQQIIVLDEEARKRGMTLTVLRAYLENRNVNFILRGSPEDVSRLDMRLIANSFASKQAHLLMLRHEDD